MNQTVNARQTANFTLETADRFGRLADNFFVVVARKPASAAA
jgi:hypothetical protein